MDPVEREKMEAVQKVVVPLCAEFIRYMAGTENYAEAVGNVGLSATEIAALIIVIPKLLNGAGIEPHASTLVALGAWLARHNHSCKCPHNNCRICSGSGDRPHIIRP